MKLNEERQHGNITHVFNHPILGEIVNVICMAPLYAEFPPMEVFWGVHRVQPDRERKGIRIGVQTETFFDESGVTLGSRSSLAMVLRSFARYDFIIDLNTSNWRIYRLLPMFLRRRVLLGPYIFPEEIRELSVMSGSNLVFMGSLNNRRQVILNSLPEKFPIQVVPDRTFGPALDVFLQSAWCIFNVHYYPGVYTEYPRILKAMASGKPVISEALDSVLSSGQHYMKLEDLFDLSFEEARAQAQVQYGNLSRHLSVNYAFRAGLRHCIGL